MKTAMKLFALGIVLLGFGINANAQVSATANTSATIVTPIAISKNVDLVFGNVAVSPTNPGTVIMATDGSRTKTGGVTLPATTGTVSAAKFTVTGAAGYTFTITLPNSPITLTDSGSNTMTVGTFVSDPSESSTLTGGTATINVGGILNVGAAQAAGIYSNATGLTVTVNYN